jgi:PIN domain nuclease of toxin-antitoxin system
MSDKLLLDTHIWIWLINGDPTLLPKTRDLINEAAEQGQVFLSTISTWEVSMLEAHGRITLSKPCLDWIKTSLKLSGIKTITISPEIAVESCQLPNNFHGDPADRMIIATARLHDLTLLTRDKKLIAYGKENYARVVKS